MATLSPHQHETLVAVAETALPAGRFIPAAGEATVDKVEAFVDRLPGPLQHGLGGLLRGLDAAAWLGERRPFAQASRPRSGSRCSSAGAGAMPSAG